MIYLCKKYLPKLQGKTVRIGLGTEDSDGPEMEIAGAILVTQFIEDVYLRDFMSCKYKLSEKFTPLFDMNEDGTLQQVPLIEMCERKVRETILFNTETDHQSAKTICQTLGGVLTGNVKSTECPTFWAPIYFNTTEGAWLTESPEPNGLEWMRNFPQAQQDRRCALVRYWRCLGIKVYCDPPSGRERDN